MARGSNGREGRAARSELPKMQVTNEPVSLDDTSVSERFFNEYREKSPQYPTKGRLNPSMSKDNLFKIGDALDEIKQKILPTKEIGLLDLSERERERYLSVRNDEKIGYTRSFNTDSNEKLQADFKELREKVQQKDGKDSPYDLADKIVVNQANDMLQAGYLGGKRDFALRASYFFDAMTKKYGEDVAARLTRASLRETYHRMQRSGMTFQEKDPRFSEQK
jgi:hypothetical protein